MVRPRFQSAVTLLAATLWLVPAGLSAPETPAPVQSGEENHDATPPHPRAISAGVAAALSASLPKYNPPKPVEKTPADDRDMRDVDKPRNKIIRLPQYVVKEKKPPVFTEREISTDKGLADIALKRYFSETGLALNRLTIPLFGISKEAYAKMLYAEDERLKNMSDLKDSARDIGLVNPENAKEIRRATQDTYDRGYDYIFNPAKH